MRDVYTITNIQKSIPNNNPNKPIIKYIFEFLFLSNLFKYAITNPGIIKSNIDNQLQILL